MRTRATILSAAVTLGVLAPNAAAKTHPTTPPGNGAVNQYIESIPTANGGRTSGSVHHVTPGGGGGSGGQTGSGTGGQGGSSATGSGTAAQSSAGISHVTQRQLDRTGRDGRAASVVARETAPSALSGGSGAPPAASPGSTSGTTAADSVFQAVVGSGTAMPIALIVCACAAVAVAILRRRSPQS